MTDLIWQPKLVTSSTDPKTGDVIVYGDGVPMFQVTQKSAIWLIARLAEAVVGKQ